MQLLSEDILKELAGVEGRYIEWEWDTRTLTNDFVAMREPDGLQVNIGKNGRPEPLPQSVPQVFRGIDRATTSFLRIDSKRTSGFRLYRLSAKGRKRGGQDS